MTALIAGTVLMLAALAFVLYPLLVSEAPGAHDARISAANHEPPRNEAVDALREIEFDRATGKLSDADYDSLKATYTQRAVETMRATSGGSVCSRCGPRPEKDALFCSNCGQPLG